MSPHGPGPDISPEEAGFDDDDDDGGAQPFDPGDDDIQQAEGGDIATGGSGGGGSDGGDTSGGGSDSGGSTSTTTSGREFGPPLDVSPEEGDTTTEGGAQPAEDPYGADTEQQAEGAEDPAATPQDPAPDTPEDFTGINEPTEGDAPNPTGATSAPPEQADTTQPGGAQPGPASGTGPRATAPTPAAAAAGLEARRRYDPGRAIGEGPRISEEQELEAEREFAEELSRGPGPEVDPGQVDAVPFVQDGQLAFRAEVDESVTQQRFAASPLAAGSQQAVRDAQIRQAEEEVQRQLGQPGFDLGDELELVTEEERQAQADVLQAVPGFGDLIPDPQGGRIRVTEEGETAISDQAAADLEEQLEEEYGVDLDDEDIAVREEDGQFFGTLSREGEETVAVQRAPFRDSPLGPLFETGARIRQEELQATDPFAEAYREATPGRGDVYGALGTVAGLGPALEEGENIDEFINEQLGAPRNLTQGQLNQLRDQTLSATPGVEDPQDQGEPGGAALAAAGLGVTGVSTTVGTGAATGLTTAAAGTGVGLVLLGAGAVGGGVATGDVDPAVARAETERPDRPFAVGELEPGEPIQEREELQPEGRTAIDVDELLRSPPAAEVSELEPGEPRAPELPTPEGAPGEIDADPTTIQASPIQQGRIEREEEERVTIGGEDILDRDELGGRQSTQQRRERESGNPFSRESGRTPLPRGRERGMERAPREEREGYVSREELRERRRAGGLTPVQRQLREGTDVDEMQPFFRRGRGDLVGRGAIGRPLSGTITSALNGEAVSDAVAERVTEAQRADVRADVEADVDVAALQDAGIAQQVRPLVGPREQADVRADTQQQQLQQLDSILQLRQQQELQPQQQQAQAQRFGRPTQYEYLRQGTPYVPDTPTETATEATETETRYPFEPGIPRTPRDVPSRLELPEFEGEQDGEATEFAGLATPNLTAFRNPLTGGILEPDEDPLIGGFGESDNGDGDSAPWMF